MLKCRVSQKISKIKRSQKPGIKGWFDALRKQATIKDNRREANM
jgi:hypothetical protein